MLYLKTNKQKELYTKWENAAHLKATVIHFQCENDDADDGLFV